MKYCQLCGETLPQMQIEPIVDVQLKTLRRGLYRIDVYNRCPSCKQTIIGYQSWYENKTYAQDQIKRMLASVKLT